MIREDIEKAAVNYDSRAVAFRAFKAGAEWRINSVWHDVKEKPKNGEMIISLRSKYSPIVCGPFNFGWKETVETFGLKRWAYIEDLIPNTEE